MNELSLFSGAGGGLLGSKLLGWTTVGYVENSDYCQKVLAQRIEDGILDQAPIFGNINGFIESGAAKKYKGFVDVVTGGFPCQPFSVAGKREAQDDSRNLWPQTLAVLCDVRPRYALLENVPGLLTVNGGGYFAQILADLAEARFDARWCVLGADQCGAPHKRRRLWILAYPIDSADRSKRRTKKETDSISGERREARHTGLPDRASDDAEVLADTDSINERARQRLEQSSRDSSGERSGDSSSDVADSDSPRLQGRIPDGIIDTERREEQGEPSSKCGTGREGFGNSVWPTEPQPICRVANGVANRVDRLRALGNGQVPRVFATAWEILTRE